MLTSQSQLKKMLVIEIIGEKLYNALTFKTKDKSLKSIYQKLAFAEFQTAKHIEKEISLTNRNNYIISKAIVANFAGFIFSLLTARQILWILKNTLKKRMYRHWFEIYKEDNRDLWDLLLKHEEFQHELLRL